ncbi:MAG: hypothetical protein JXQ68_00485 [Campylobacterales bacterium]|nr:hypothetical protein [Campylobacterales bacterium]
MKELFREFYSAHKHLEFEQAIEYFSIFGGTGRSLEFDYFDNLLESIKNLLQNNFTALEKNVSPNYILESPYKEILIAAARGDGRIYAILKKAKISEALGEQIVKELEALSIIHLEQSREDINNAVKRGYRIQAKIRFEKPFYRFWFGFVEPYRNFLLNGNSDKFTEYFQKGHERLRSLVFEQLSNEILEEYFAKSDPIISHGSYWDKDNEFDIIAVTRKGCVIFGECKYKNRKVCKSELSKLIIKSQSLHVKADIYVLFSKHGFSNELSNNPPKNVLLFDLNNMEQMLI